MGSWQHVLKGSDDCNCNIGFCSIVEAATVVISAVATELVVEAITNAVVGVAVEPIAGGISARGGETVRNISTSSTNGNGIYNIELVSSDEEPLEVSKDSGVGNTQESQV